MVVSWISFVDGLTYSDSKSFMIHHSFCPSEISGPPGQGYCQGGFSADFTTVNVHFLSVNQHGFLG